MSTRPQWSVMYPVVEEGALREMKEKSQLLPTCPCRLPS